MSKNSSDKSTYSVDEMMEKLRDGEREKEAEGELVTREDGTQVRRVKKRKRRTKQKKHEEAKKQKRRSIFKTLACIIVPLGLGLGALLLLAKYHSPGFAEGVVATIWERTGANAKVSRLSPKGTHVTASAASLNWPDGQSLEQLKVTDVSGDLSLVSSLTGKLRGTELKASKGYLLLSNREGRKVSEPSGESKVLPGFERYGCDFFTFYFGRTKSSFRLEGTKARFVPTDYSNQLHLTGGDLTAGAWGKLPLKRGTLEFINETIKVVSLRFEEDERRVILSGDLALADSIHSLTVEASEGTVDSMGGFGLGKLVSSKVDGATGTLVFRPWSAASHEMTLSCRPKYLVLQNFAFLSVLEELYSDTKFQELEFEMTSDFELIRNSSGARITGLELEELGILAIQGEVAIEGESLGGSLRVGLPDHKRLTLNREQRKDFFSKGTLEEGFFWFDVQLGGTTSNPEDNFSNYLDGEGTAETPEDLFEQLTR